MMMVVMMTVIKMMVMMTVILMMVIVAELAHGHQLWQGDGAARHVPQRSLQ